MIVELDHRYMETCLKIERKCFSEPWTRAMLQGEFDQPTSLLWGWVEGETEELVGYSVGWLIFEDFHVANLAVLPEWRRQGIGRKLLNYMLAWAAEHHAVRALLEVRESNKPAVALYRELGFSLLGTRPNYYRSPTENALLLKKKLV